MNTPTTIEGNKPALPTWARIPLFIIAFIILSGIFQILGLMIAKIPLADAAKISELGTSKLLIVQFWTLVPMLILVVVFRKFIDRKAILSLGFSIKKRGADLGIGLLMAVLTTGTNGGLHINAVEVIIMVSASVLVNLLNMVCNNKEPKITNAG